jgi:ATP-dependent exoDNAse (exonuclease V) beta subunit
LAPPFVELHLSVGSKTDGALHRAASALAFRLIRLVEDDEVLLYDDDTDSGGPCARPLDYGDVSILCRASSAFPYYENALEEAGIPFLTIAGGGFYDRPEVRDLLNALQALAQPHDDLAMAGLLRSPAMGLSDMALYCLRRAQSSMGRPSLWSVLTAEDGALPSSLLEDEVDSPRGAVAWAAHLVARLHAMVGRVPVADVLKHFLDATAYQASLLRDGQARAAGNVAKLLADAHASGIVGVDAFIDTVSELRSVAPREGEARTISAGAVQIMTVHQAKGLEFPIVCIGDAAKQTPGASGVLIDGELGIVPQLSDDRLASTVGGGREAQRVSSAAYRLARSREERQMAAESDRMLYVAATRAREMLLISGTVSARKSGRIGLSGWLDRLDTGLRLRDRAPFCDGEGAAIHRFMVPAGHHSVRCTIYEPDADLPAATAAGEVRPVLEPPLGLALLAPAAATKIRLDEASREAETEPPRHAWRVVPRTDRPRAPSWVVGKLVHVALEHWIFPGEPEPRFEAWAPSQARVCGTTDEAVVRDAVRRAAALLTRFQGSPLHAEMATAHRILREVPYSMMLKDGTVEVGTIDALFQGDDGWLLVEFKTDRIDGPADLESKLDQEDHVAQVARYVGAAEHLLGRRPKPLLCFLNCGGRVRLVDDRW